MTLLTCVVIGELLPGDSKPITALSTANVNDKVLHFGAYAVLALVPAIGFHRDAALRFMIVTEVVGLGLEGLQILVPQRSCDAADIAANTIGVVVGAVLGRVLRSSIVRDVQSDH